MTGFPYQETSMIDFPSERPMLVHSSHPLRSPMEDSEFPTLELTQSPTSASVEPTAFTTQDPFPSQEQSPRPSQSPIDEIMTDYPSQGSIAGQSFRSSRAPTEEQTDFPSSSPHSEVLVPTLSPTIADAPIVPQASPRPPTSRHGSDAPIPTLLPPHSVPSFPSGHASDSPCPSSLPVPVPRTTRSPLTLPIDLPNIGPVLHRLKPPQVMLLQPQLVCWFARSDQPARITCNRTDVASFHKAKCTCQRKADHHYISARTKYQSTNHKKFQLCYKLLAKNLPLPEPYRSMHQFSPRNP
jgi:hypothetical protein